jgi:hypothetical protein
VAQRETLVTAQPKARETFADSLIRAVSALGSLARERAKQLAGELWPALLTVGGGSVVLLSGVLALVIRRAQLARSGSALLDEARSSAERTYTELILACRLGVPAPRGRARAPARSGRERGAPGAGEGVETLRPLTPFEWVRSLFGAQIDLRSGKEGLTVCAFSLVEGLVAGFARAGIHDVLSFLVDKRVVYMDSNEVPDDLPLIAHAAQAASILDHRFREMHLVLAHRDELLHTLIDCKITSEVVLGEAEMLVVLSSRIAHLQIQRGETAEQYAERVRAFAAQPDSFEPARLRLEELSQRIASALQPALVGSEREQLRLLLVLGRLHLGVWLGPRRLWLYVQLRVLRGLRVVVRLELQLRKLLRLELWRRRRLKSAQGCAVSGPELGHLLQLPSRAGSGLPGSAGMPSGFTAAGPGGKALASRASCSSWRF